MGLGLGSESYPRQQPDVYAPSVGDGLRAGVRVRVTVTVRVTGWD